MNKRSSPTALPYLLVAALLVGTLVYLAMQTRSINVEASNRITNTLRELKQVDAEWNVDILRSKTGLATNYDRVAGALPRVSTLNDELGSAIGSYWRENPDSLAQIHPVVAEFSAAMTKKIDLIEQFKSQNAILRNSSRYLPVASTDLVAATRDSALDLPRKLEIERVLNDMLSNTMNFIQTGDASLKDKIALSRDELKQLPESDPEAVRSNGQMLAAHVGTLMEQQEDGTRLLEDISALPTARLLDRIADAHAAENVKLVERLQRYQWALAAYSAALLLLLGYAVVRLLRNYRQINRANEALEKAHAELKESQVHLVQAEKMSALGQMVAGIAHEINTPLAYVKGSVNILRDHLPSMSSLITGQLQFLRLMQSRQRDAAALSESLKSTAAIARRLVDNNTINEMDILLDDSVHGIDQISEIVQNLKNFSRLDRERVSTFSVESGLDSTLLLARNLLKNRVTVHREYGRVPQVSGSPSQINQVFLNIITNAVHAMPESRTDGLIVLRTSVDEDAAMVRIEISDNGTGIADDVLPKIFDPFFTTKVIGEGTGMGLSISYKIVAEHGGRISASSSPGSGTTFVILLPLSAAPAPAELAPESGSTLFVD